MKVENNQAYYAAYCDIFKDYIVQQGKNNCWCEAASDALVMCMSTIADTDYHYHRNNIRDDLLLKFGYNGGRPLKAMKYIIKEYGLKNMGCEKVTNILEPLMGGRPAILNFGLRESEWDKVMKDDALPSVYRSRAALYKGGGPDLTKKGYHAVVVLGIRRINGLVWVLIKNSWLRYRIKEDKNYLGLSWVRYNLLKEKEVFDLWRSGLDESDCVASNYKSMNE
jgi:hypothetical protein